MEDRKMAILNLLSSIFGRHLTWLKVKFKLSND